MGSGHDHGGGGHAHNHAAGANSRMLAIALALTTAFLVAEVVAAFAFNSLALLSDAAHMGTDAAALATGLTPGSSVAVQVERGGQLVPITVTVPAR